MDRKESQRLEKREQASVKAIRRGSVSKGDLEVRRMKLILSLAAVLATMAATAVPANAADRDYYTNYDRDGLYYESYEDLADYREDYYEDLEDYYEDSSDYSSYSFPYYSPYGFYPPFYGYSPSLPYNFRD